MAQMVKTIKEYLDGKVGRINLPNEFREEFKEYNKVPVSLRFGRTWFKVYWSGTDSKYGAFMICPDTKEWRNLTISEFYGGAIVD